MGDDLSAPAPRRGASHDVAWSGAQQVVQVITTGASFYMLGRTLGTTGYGAYLGVAGVVAPLGALSYTGVRLAALERLLRDHDDPTDTARAYLTLAGLQSVAAAVVAVLVGALVVDLPVLTIALLAVADLVGLGTVTVVSSVVHRFAGFAAGSRTRIAAALARLGALSVLFATDRLTILSLAVTTAGTYLVVVVVLLAWRLPSLGVTVGWRAPRRGELRRQAHFSLPMFAESLKTDGDKAFLNAYGFVSDAGVYGAAYRVMTLALLPIRSINEAAFHRFLGSDDAGADDQRRRSRRYSGLAVGVATVTAVAVAVAAPAFEWLVGDAFGESVAVIRWLAPFLVVRAAAVAPLSALVALGRLEARSRLLLASSAVSLVLYATLIPVWSWGGAVVGTYAGELLVCAGAWWLVHRQPDAPRTPVGAAG